MKHAFGFMTVLGVLACAGRAGAETPPSRYAFPAEGTVYDTRTKLTWQRNKAVGTYLQSAAAHYCNDLELAGRGWRLPSRAELLTLVDPTRANPAIDPDAFPGQSTSDDFVAITFWSSSSYVLPEMGYNGWIVEFGHGSPGRTADSEFSVRCVR